jgi:hypothetical protein
MQNDRSPRRHIHLFIVILQLILFSISASVSAVAEEAAKANDAAATNEESTAAATVPASAESDDRGGEPSTMATGDTAAFEEAREPAETTETQDAVAVSMIAQDPEPEAEKPVVEEKKESSWTDKFSLKGDFRYRFEMIDIIPDADDAKMRYRHRIRGRLGVGVKMSHGLKALFQLATGSEDPVSTNQTLTNAFSTKPLWIDLAFVEWAPEFAKGLLLVAGKMKNPFRRPVKSELVWDGDLNPEGLALGYEGDFGVVAPFVQTGGFFVEERKSEQNSWLLGVQAGLKVTLAEGLFHIDAGVGYFDHTEIKGSEVYFDPEDSFGNTAELIDPEDPEAAELAYVHDYNLVEGYIELGGKIVRFPWAVFGDIVKNVADGVDDDLGWLVGVKFGKTKKALDFDLRYIYRIVESDAVVGLFTDSDFIGGGTNGRGHEWNVGFQAVDAMKIGASFFYNNMPAHDEDDIPTDDYRRFQLDFQFKF